MKNKRKLAAQELFWKGKFGVDYIKRNFDAQISRNEQNFKKRWKTYNL